MNNVKKRLSILCFVLLVTGLSMAGCRNRELCPAYTDSQPVIEQQTAELI